MAGTLQTVIRDLQRPRGRERRSLTLAEGVRLVEEAVARRVEITGAAWSPSLTKNPRGAALLESLQRVSVQLEKLSDREMKELAETEQPQGVIAVVRPRRWTFKDLDLKTRPAVLVLDAVQDPGNAGTLLRTAQGLGAAGVLALPGTVELTNPKVIRGSMGALFSLPALAVTVDELLLWSKERKVPLLIAEAGAEPVGKKPVPKPVAIVLGNEGVGISPVIREAGRPVAIPLVPGTESLNVAVAGALLLYEVLRER